MAFGDVGDERPGVGIGVAQEVDHGRLAVEQDFTVDDGQVDVRLCKHGAAFFDQLRRQLARPRFVSFYFIGRGHADDFSPRFVAVVLRGKVFRRGEHFADFLASVRLQDDSVTMLAFDAVDVAENSDPAERSVADEVSMNAVVDICRQRRFLRESFTVDFDRAVINPYGE